MATHARRFQALDTLRGITLALMVLVNMSVGEAKSYAPLLHAAWHGLTLTDLVFPTFLFVVGGALSRTLEGYQRRGEGFVLRKVLTRTLLLFAIGYLLSWFPFARIDATGHWALMPIAHTRIPGVLQRIALGYGCAALIVNYGGRAAALAYSVVALLGSWWLMSAFGDYSLTGNAARSLDLWALGAAHLYHGEGIAFDPEGILSTLPAIANVLAGYLCGQLVQRRGPGYEAIAKLLMTGVVLIAVAIAWDSVLPINKKLWTSSYALCTAGIDCAVLGLLVYVVELRGLRAWSYFFDVFGRNTLLVFLLSEAVEKLLFVLRIGGERPFDWLYANAFESWAGDKPGSLLYALTYMLACWLVAFAFDRRRIYWKL